MTKSNVSQLMQHPVLEIDPDAEVQFVSGLARSMGVHYFPLVRGGSLIGLVCACDLDDAKPQRVRQQQAPQALGSQRAALRKLLGARPGGRPARRGRR